MQLAEALPPVDQLVEALKRRSQLEVENESRKNCATVLVISLTSLVWVHRDEDAF